MAVSASHVLPEVSSAAQIDKAVIEKPAIWKPWPVLATVSDLNELYSAMSMDIFCFSLAGIYIPLHCIRLFPNFRVVVLAQIE